MMKLIAGRTNGKPNPADALRAVQELAKDLDNPYVVKVIARETLSEDPAMVLAGIEKALPLVADLVEALAVEV